MENRDELIKYFIDNHVVTNKNGKLRVISMYKHSASRDVIDKVNKFISGYRSEKEAWYCLKNNITEIPKCPICGNPVKFADKKYNLTCENCSANTLDSKRINASNIMRSKSHEFWRDVRKKAKKTLLERYGDENYSLYGSKSFKENMFNKYGDEHYSNHDKAVKTCIERYGVPCNLSIGSEGRSKSIWDKKHDEIAEKVRRTNIEKYGVNYMSDRSKLIWDKRKRRSMDFEKSHNCTSVRTLIDIYGQGWKSLNLPLINDGGLTYIDNSYINDIVSYMESDNTKSRSDGEIELYNYVKSIIGDKQVLHNTYDIIPPYELDIYIPSKHIAIEYNGIYWHSSENKQNNYHLTKTHICNDNGIRLIHIFEDEWLNNKNKIKSLIMNVLGLHDVVLGARECDIVSLTSEDYMNFCDNYHLQCSVNAKYRYGLIYNGELVQCIGLGKSRYKKDEIELYRMCTKSGYIIRGGFSKLMKCASKNIKKDIISFIDISKYTGDGYLKSGWNILYYTNPSYFYVKCYTKGGSIYMKRLSRVSCQKHKLSNILEKFDPNLTEIQNMRNNNYYCVYDCGTLKMIYKYDESR